MNNAVALVGGLSKWIVIGVPAVLLIGVGGLVAAAFLGSPASVIAGLGVLAASLGISWKGTQASLGKVATKLETPLWQAELDAAVVEAITRLDEFE